MSDTITETDYYIESKYGDRWIRWDSCHSCLTVDDAIRLFDHYKEQKPEMEFQLIEKTTSTKVLKETTKKEV